MILTLKSSLAGAVSTSATKWADWAAPAPVSDRYLGMSETDIYLAAGLRTPFVKVDGVFKGEDALRLSVPVVKAMAAQLAARANRISLSGAP